MSVDYSCLFPTGMLMIGLHPQKEMEVDLCWAYNRWLTEKVLPEAGGRFFSMLCLPFSDPDEALRQVETFGDRKHVGGFMVTSARTTGGPRQRLHEGLSRHRGARPGAVVPLRRQLGRAGLQELQPLHRRCMRSASPGTTSSTDQLGHQRPRRALPQAAGDLDRIRPRLGAVPDAAARPRIHAAAVGMPAAEKEAVGLHARHVLFVAADGDSGLRRDGDAPSA